MFLTQADFKKTSAKRKRGSGSSFSGLSTGKSPNSSKFQRLTDSNFNYVHKSTWKSSISQPMEVDLSAIVQTNSEKKWRQIVDLYRISDIEPEQGFRKIRPGFSFYKILANAQLLKKFRLEVNFPETFIDFSGDLYRISTHPVTKQVQSVRIERQQFKNVIEQLFQKQIDKIRQFPNKYKDYYDYRHNPNAPVIITKGSDDSQNNFQLEVESYKTLHEKRTRPWDNKIIQHYIYPRNMKAMTMRICFRRNKRGDQRHEFYAERFQNVDNIFRANNKNKDLYETYTHQAVVNPTYERENKAQYSRITKTKGLQKYIQPTKRVIQFLQRSQRIKINQICLDFITDLLDVPWLINMKKISYEQTKSLSIFNSKDAKLGELATGNYSLCKLCNCQFLRQKLNRTVSNTMFAQFVKNLKKRLTVSEYKRVQFVKEAIKSTQKGYSTMKLCQNCYQIVQKELKLIECSKKLAVICNNSPQIENQSPCPRHFDFNPVKQQWRLMAYLVDINDLPSKFLNTSNAITIKLRLGNSLQTEAVWKIRPSQQTLLDKKYANIQRVKVHYFFAEKASMKNFVKNTTLNIQIANENGDKIIAEGSSSILTSFERQLEHQFCLRQTGTVLMFFNQEKYCQMTIKVGLVYDGVYEIPKNVALTDINGIFLASNSFYSSNPIPEQWMQSFEPRTRPKDQAFRKDHVQRKSLRKVSMKLF